MSVISAKIISAALVVLLAVVALRVSLRHARQFERETSETWFLIALYWVILTIKNVMDLIAMWR